MGAGVVEVAAEEAVAVVVHGGGQRMRLGALLDRDPQQRGGRGQEVRGRVVELGRELEGVDGERRGHIEAPPPRRHERPLGRDDRQHVRGAARGRRVGDHAEQGVGVIEAIDQQVRVRAQQQRVQAQVIGVHALGQGGVGELGDVGDGTPAAGGLDGLGGEHEAVEGALRRPARGLEPCVRPSGQPAACLVADRPCRQQLVLDPRVMVRPRPRATPPPRHPRPDSGAPARA